MVVAAGVVQAMIPLTTQLLKVHRGKLVMGGLLDILLLTSVHLRATVATVQLS